MADSKKGNSTADSKSKSAALDEDFGDHFLSFWGPSKKGKDKADFDMEEIPRSKKKSFNFDKLDDFELGGDFDKLPSFKMDMPDLDFSGPVMKAEKPTGKPTGKQQMEQEKFSFNFDFNGLDRFDLDSSPVEGDKKPCKRADSNASDNSYKYVRNQNSRSNSDTVSDVFKDLENKKPLNTDGTATSKPENLIVDSTTKVSTPSISQDLEHHDVFHEPHTSTDEQIVVSEENKNGTHTNEGHREQPEETCFMRTNAEKTTQDFILQSVSGNCSEEQDNPQLQVGPTSSDAVKADSLRERDDSMRTVDSSQSRNSSPVNSYNTGCRPETIMNESLDASGDLQKHCKWNQNDITGRKEVPSESTRGQMDVQNASFTDVTLIPSPLQRDARAVFPKSLNEKVAGALQLNSLSKSADNASEKTSSATKKLLGSILNNKLKTLNMYPVNENRKPKKNCEQAETWKVGILKSYSEKGISDISMNERDEQNDTFSRTKLSSYTANSVAAKETKSTRVSESISEFPLNTASKMATTALTEKSRSVNSFLKRKTFEESTADPEISKPLKCAMESVTGRKPFQISQQAERVVFPATENREAAHNDYYKEELASNDVPKLGSLKLPDIEVPLLIDKDGNVKKSKELNGTSSVKQITVVEENRKETHSSEGHGEQSKGTGLTKVDFQLTTSSLQQPTITSNTAKSIMPNSVSSIASVKSSKIIPIEMNGSSPKDDKTFDCKLTTSSLTKLNSKRQNSATIEEAKSVRFSESKSHFPLKTASKMENSISEKSAYFPALLKRKTFEDSTDDPNNSNPLKRVIKLAIGRKPFKVSPKTESAMVTITENLEPSYTENCAEDLNSNEVAEVGGSAGLEVIAALEKDENVEKAEIYMKQLDDMCDMLRKKHEKARELLVRAAVNNNTLLMLNHPLLEEKICSLQRFATSLQSKKFF